MPEEYIMSSKACVYVLGGAANTASLFDFDGVYILDGGFAEKSQGFAAHVRNVSAVLLSAPTLANLGTTAALLEQDKPVPVFTNTKPLKSAKPGSSGEVVKSIQEANSKFLSVAPPLFNPKYPAHIIYQSAAKGVLSLYILAGDVKDSEVITKALASGNEQEVEKAAAEHGTVGVLLWRPAQADKPAVRVLLSGTSTLSRIQQSLDKAAKSLPFLNAAQVKSKDALSDIPAPSLPRPSVTGAGAGTKPRPATSTATSRPGTAAAPARALTSRAPAPSRAPPTRPAPAAKALPTSRAPLASKAPVRPAAAAAPKRPEPVAQKKTVGKVQAAPSKVAPVSKAPVKTAPPKAAAPPAKAPAKAQAPPTKPAPPPAVHVDSLDDSVICLSDLNNSPSNLTASPMDIVVIPPTPEPPRHEEQAPPTPKEPEEKKKEPEEVPEPPKEIDDVANLADVEDEIPPPVDAFKKPEPEDVTPKPEDVTPKPEDVTPKPEDVTPKPEDVTPKVPEDLLTDFDPLAPSHPEPSAPSVPADHVIISTPDPNLPDIVAAVPFVPPTPKGPNDGLIRLEDDEEKVAPGFEEPLIAQAPREDGTLADCSEELSKLVEISMDTDKSTEAGAILSEAIGEVTQLTSELKSLGLDEKTDEYVRKLSNQMVEEATLPFTSAFASSIVSESNGAEPNGHHQNENGAKDSETSEAPKLHDLMQSRSSVIENGAPVNYEKPDPVLDDVLAACAQESEKLDSETLHMPAVGGAALAAKPVKFARPYYFDVATVPRNEKLETTVDAAGLQEFVSKIRAKNVILASRDISGEQLNAILAAKQTWIDPAHPCTVIPTHSSPILLDFRQKNEEQFGTVHLNLAIPVEKQRTTVSSEAGAVEYELARISLE